MEAFSLEETELRHEPSFESSNGTVLLIFWINIWSTKYNKKTSSPFKLYFHKISQQ